MGVQGRGEGNVKLRFPDLSMSYLGGIIFNFLNNIISLREYGAVQQIPNAVWW